MKHFTRTAGRAPRAAHRSSTPSCRLELHARVVREIKRLTQSVASRTQHNPIVSSSPVLAAAAVAAALALCRSVPALAVVVAEQPLPQLSAPEATQQQQVARQQTYERSIPPCPASASSSSTAPCVSTSSFASPANYLPPWTYYPDSRQDAIRQLVAELRALPGATVTEIDEEQGYVAAAVPYARGSDVDDLEFLLLPPDDEDEYKQQQQQQQTEPRGSSSSSSSSISARSRLVLYRSSSRKRLGPDPAFCWTPGCISGPGNRGRLEALRDSLGWASAETDEDKKWLRILLH